MISEIEFLQVGIVLVTNLAENTTQYSYVSAAI